MRIFHLIFKIWQDWQILFWIAWEEKIQDQFHFQLNFVTWFIFIYSTQNIINFQVLNIFWSLEFLLVILGPIPPELTRLVVLKRINLVSELLLDGLKEDLKSFLSFNKQENFLFLKGLSSIWHFVIYQLAIQVIID